MPNIEVTRKELELLIDAMVILRVTGGTGHADVDMLLPDLHLKLENALELWIYGGEVKLPVTPRMKEMGVVGWTKVCPPHDEGCDV